MTTKNICTHLTGDGSPSLQDMGESMHHRGGAYTETQYIYGQCLRDLRRSFDEFSVLVIGLGLGYIEILSALEYLAITKTPPEKLTDGRLPPFFMQSFESEVEWVEYFLSWLQDEKENPLGPIYDLLFSFYAKDYSVTATELKAFLYSAYAKPNPMSSWVISRRLDREGLTQIQRPFQFILFDAYSTKTSPELWGEDFLADFLKLVTRNTSSLFATYACTGVLMRSLRAHGYQVTKKPGFFGKRDSTSAFFLPKSITTEMPQA